MSLDILKQLSRNLFKQSRFWLLAATLIFGLSILLGYYLWHYVCPNLTVMTNEGKCLTQANIQGQPILLLLTSLFFLVSSLTVPCAILLNNRFAENDWLKHDPGRLLRQSGWGGLMAVIIAYLQLIRAMNWAIAFVLLAVFVLIETFILTRE